MKREAVVLKEVMLESSRLGMRLFRNNRGMFYTMDGRKIRAGLEAPGASDLVGYDNKGRFCAVEVKSERGKASAEQLNFIAQVQKYGGFGCVVKNSSELKEKYCAYIRSGIV